jgi:diguanylate cyclase (GGDEF)-like protein
VRLGGDEFAIILKDVNMEAIQAVAEKISTGINQPIAIGQDFVTVGISIGISSAPSDADNKFEMIQKADKAMYSAKTLHKNYQFYADI